MNSANEVQVGGDHYRSVYQHWDWVTDLNIHYLVACSTKYLTRWCKKNGLEDLEKSLHYMVKWMERGMPGDFRLCCAKPNATHDFLEINKVGEEERVIIREIIILMHTTDPTVWFERVKPKLDALLANAQRAIQGQAMPAATLAPAKGATLAPALPCGGAGGMAGQGNGARATAQSQLSGLSGMKHPFGYDEEKE